VGTRNIKRAIDFYTLQLGFKLTFRDKADPPNYVDSRRDAVELHMQFQFDYEMGTIRLRFLVEDPDGLFNEYRQRGVECSPEGVRDTPWMTREFALYDLYQLHNGVNREFSGSRDSGKLGQLVFLR
jgi:catechol 2,3-dioxygenase-like lactoylglutathione lyase family enzyme